MPQPPEDASGNRGQNPPSAFIGNTPLKWGWLVDFCIWGFVILVLLLGYMRFVLCAPSNEKDKSSDYHAELQAISERTTAIQKAIADQCQQEKTDVQNIQTTLGTCTTSLATLSDQLKKLNDQVSQMKKGDESAEVSRQLRDIDQDIASVRLLLGKLQSVSSKKTIGLINIDSSTKSN